MGGLDCKGKPYCDQTTVCFRGWILHSHSSGSQEMFIHRGHYKEQLQRTLVELVLLRLTGQ